MLPMPQRPLRYASAITLSSPRFSPLIAIISPRHFATPLPFACCRRRYYFLRHFSLLFCCHCRIDIAMPLSFAPLLRTLDAAFCRHAATLIADD